MNGNTNYVEELDIEAECVRQNSLLAGYLNGHWNRYCFVEIIRIEKKKPEENKKGWRGYLA